MRPSPSHSRAPARRRRRAAGACTAVLAAALALAGESAAQFAWRPAAPTSIQSNAGVVAGRVNVAIPDPADANVMYVATDGARPTAANGGNPLGIEVVGLPDTGGGGVWKTTNWLDENPHWVPLTDDMPSLSVGVNGLAMAPTDPQTLYAAADGPDGAVLRTTDGGRSWTALGRAQFAGVKFGGIAVSPADANVVYVGVFRPDATTPGGVYRSWDGGASWQLAGDMRGNVSHVLADPVDPGVVYAGLVDAGEPARQGVWKSTDYGGTWQPQIAAFPAGTFDAVLYIGLAIAPQATQHLMAAVLRPASAPEQKLYATASGGAQWERLCPTSGNPDNRYWHQPLAFHPFDYELVYAEGTNHDAVYSATGGRARPDGHGGLTCDGVWKVFWTTDDPAGFAFYRDPGGVDGIAFAAWGDRGIYRVSDTAAPSQATNFTRKQGDLANPLLSALAVHPDDPENLRAIGFDQIFALEASAATGTFWRTMPIGAEFGKPLFNPRNPAIEYNLTPVGGGFATYDTAIQRNAGSGWLPIGGHGFTPADFPYARSLQTNAAPWKAFEFDPLPVAEGLLFGATRVYAWTPDEPFRPISPELVTVAAQPNATTSFISALAIAPSAPLRVYAGTSEGALYVTDDRAQWQRTAGPALPAASFPARIVVDPARRDNVVVAVQGAFAAGRVWASADGGGSFVELTTDLPPGLQVYTVAVDWAFPGPALFVGTDRGVYVTQLWPRAADGALSLDTAGLRWQRFGEGLPNTLVADLTISPPSILTAATYGRGAFRVLLPTPR